MSTNQKVTHEHFSQARQPPPTPRFPEGVLSSSAVLASCRSSVLTCPTSTPDRAHGRAPQVVLTTIEPHASSSGSYDAYEYVVHSHQYITDDIPAARFSYELSPIQARAAPARSAALVPPDTHAVFLIAFECASGSSSRCIRDGSMSGASDRMGHMSRAECRLW